MPTAKNNAKTILDLKVGARLDSGLSCSQSRTPARTFLWGTLVRIKKNNVRNKLLPLVILMYIGSVMIREIIRMKNNGFANIGISQS
ncbi:hypothetical protein SAMN05660903_03668 [Salegentibacter salinarum]|nr:hypothetical protein SAMN05660903_03668 [Salegentibacter salinarum]